MGRLPTVREAVEAGWTCVTDPTSIEGLRTVVRLFSEEWDALVRCGCRPRGQSPGTEATLGEVLRSGHVADLLPRNPDDGGRIRPLRAAAAAAIRYAGHYPCREVTGAGLEELRLSIAKEYKAGTTNRTLRVIRKAVRVHAELCGLEIGSLVARRGGRRIGGRRPRRRPSPGEVMRLLEVSDPTLRGAIVGAVAAGLLPSEILLQEVRDTGRGAACLRVVHPRTRGLPGVQMVRVAPLAAWGRPIWLAARRQVQCPFPDAAVLPGEGPDPRVAKQSLDKALRGACLRAFGRRGARYTWLELRLVFQDAAVSAGLPRAVVRGTNSIADRGLGRRRAKRLERRAAAFAEAWTNLFEPPGGWTRRVGRRAPGGTPANQPEQVRRRSTPPPVEPLPTSCRPPVRRRDRVRAERPPPRPARRPEASQSGLASPSDPRQEWRPPAPPLLPEAGSVPSGVTRTTTTVVAGRRPGRRPTNDRTQDPTLPPPGEGAAGGPSQLGLIVPATFALLALGAAVGDGDAEFSADDTDGAPPGPSCPFSLSLLQASAGWQEG